jgi:hypothetical protein
VTVEPVDGHDWASRGLPELLAALAEVRRAVGALQLVIAGRGPAPDDLRAAAAAADARLVESPDDPALATLYAAADLFVLCAPGSGVRQQAGGVGDGLVLTEAQLAGCPVVGPVTGGARDAYLDGVTGATPGDGSPAALAAVLTDLLADRARLARMRRRAAEWARMSTEPAEHARAVFTAVLGTAPVTPLTGEPSAGWTAPPQRPAGTAPTRPGAAPAQTAPAQRRSATQVWPAPAEDDYPSPDDLESSRGWSDDVEVVE